MENNCTMTFSDFVKSFGPLITACATISVFYLASRRDKKKEIKKAKKERMNRVKYFEYIATEATKTINNQYNGLKTHLEAVDKEKFLAVPLSYYHKRSCEQLVDLISSESTFLAINESTTKQQDESILTFSKISSKATFLNHLLESIMTSVKENFDYIQTQTRLIQSEVDDLLIAINSLTLSLQENKQPSEVDELFVESIKDINDILYSQKTQGLETFYNYLILPLEKVVSNSKVITFSNINDLLAVARFRDRAERMYQELFGSHKIYTNDLKEETNLLKRECDNLNTLLDLLNPNNN